MFARGQADLRLPRWFLGAQNTTPERWPRVLSSPAPHPGLLRLVTVSPRRVTVSAHI